MVTHANVDDWFTFHPVADDDQRSAYEEIRASGRSFAHQILDAVPPGTERDEAIARLREVVMWSNAGIACYPRKLPPDAPYAKGYAGMSGVQIGDGGQQSNTFR